MCIKYFYCFRQKLKILLILYLIFFTRIDLFAQTSEYEMKAIAFEKLSLFIEWPAHTFDKAKEEFIIGILGKNPFGNNLEEVYKVRKIKNKNVKIIYIKDIYQVADCHILFISKTEKNELKKILDFTKTKPILTIADSEGFAEAGCFINFYNYENKLRFEINQKALESASFTVDYKLLHVSKIVNTNK